MKTAAELSARLQELHPRTAESPLFNPVFQLSLEISRALEGEGLSIPEVGAIVSELECESLMSRANRLVRLLSPMAIADNRRAFAELANGAESFEAFAQLWASPLFHVVFTAHPTFLLTPAQSD